MLESIILAILGIFAVVVVFATPYFIFKALVKIPSLINRKNISRIIDYVSAEWVFNFFPNGGTATVLRTLFLGTLICVSLYALHSILTKGFVPLNSIIDNNMYKILGIYAAVYAAFYARFVSQWTYLSNFYNSIRDQELAHLNPSPSAKDFLRKRKAEFIFDAINLHLDNKEKFAAKIYLWLDEDNNIAKDFIELCPHGIENPYKAKVIFFKHFERVTKSLDIK